MSYWRPGQLYLDAAGFHHVVYAGDARDLENQATPLGFPFRADHVLRAQSLLPGVPDAGDGYTPVELQQEIQSLMNPVAPSGSDIVATVEDLQSQTRIKVQRARQAVSVTMDLLGHDLLQASLWMDIRQAQDPQRHFGPVTTAAWSAVRKVISLRTDPDKMPSQSDPVRAAAFVKAVPASTFYAGTNPPASTGQLDSSLTAILRWVR